MLCSATLEPSVQRLGNISLEEALYIKSEKRYDDACGGCQECGRGVPGSGIAEAELCCCSGKVEVSGLNTILKMAFIRLQQAGRLLSFSPTRLGGLSLSSISLLCKTPLSGNQTRSFWKAI
ncbi:unnamed protein product [Tuber aestivum]|uniref:Uncharacterized protein n=1 Tax=Tuber aestivum TaxID=59557 RepID=A0A292PXH2_9PEZI|nr:unnamed protein product [Tuber aestivum]